MTLQEAIEVFRNHQKNSVRDKTRESYAGWSMASLEMLPKGIASRRETGETTGKGAR